MKKTTISKFSSNIIKAEDSRTLIGGQMPAECNKSESSSCTASATMGSIGTDTEGDTNYDVDCFPSAS